MRQYSDLSGIGKPIGRRKVLRMRRAARVLIEAAAPWSIACALVVSFTAAAGENTRVLDREFRRSTMIEPHRLTLTPPRLSTLSIQPTVSTPAPADATSAEWTKLIPHIRKVDLGRELARPQQIGAPLFFVLDRTVLPERKLDPAVTIARASQALLARLSRFEGRTLAPGMHGGTSGDVAAQGTSPQRLALSRPDGATPAVSRAVILASVTPAPVEPEIIAAAAMRIPAFAHVHASPRGGAVETAKLKLGAGYLDLIDPESLKREQKCLAEAIYFESRSEPEDGQAAVAQVVLNRVKSGLYPTNVCGVVYQNRHKYKACQFTFACEGKSLAINDAASWSTAQRIARDVMEGESYNSAVGASTHYHATYVAPYWSRKLKRTDRIGRHIFYRLRPGQT
ncbi:MAG: cell wall hydrolase [Beijerinckiaceae bacterium]|nr:MAG: cell wall hydrolase [Beijerinckiaceae bacterium]